MAAAHVVARRISCDADSIVTLPPTLPSTLIAAPCYLLFTLNRKRAE